MCSELYSMYNSNEGVNNQRLIEIINNIVNKINTVTEYDRDSYYSFLRYFQYYDHYPEISLNIILALADHILYINNTMVPLITLYAGEALIKTGNNEKAFTYFNGLKKLDNDSVIAEYYIAKLNDQKSNISTNMEEFKKKHPSFWMINK